MTHAFLTWQQLLALGRYVQPIGYLAGAAIVLFMLVDVWRSGAGVGAKIGWTICSVIGTVMVLAGWLVWGRKRANREADSD